MKRYLLKNKYSIITIIGMIFLWEISALYIDNEILFPRIENFFYSLKEIILDNKFITIVSNTINTLLLSVVISLLLAIVSSVLALNYEIFRYLFRYFFNILRSTPSVIIIVLVIIWSSIRVVPLVVSITIGTPLLYDNIIGGVSSMEKNIISMAKIYGVSRIDILKKIYLPGVYFFMCQLLGGIISLVFKVVVASEILSQKNNTIGGEIFLNKVYLDIGKIFGWVVIIIGINFLINQIFSIFDKKIRKWKNI